MLKLGILGSGTGTNFDAICNAVDKGDLHADIVLVLSDNPDAPILEKARERGIPAFYVDPGSYKTKMDQTHEIHYIRLLKEYKAEYIILAGFMRVIKDSFFEHYDKKILNIHPSLLPAFPGLKAWTQALDYGVKIAGCSVHFVEPAVDAGPIIIQASVPVFQDDTPEKLHQRIHRKEYEIYPKAIELIAQGKICFDGRKVLIQS
ncbi:MAG: phosphoribosylglycinamide formyltransferase [Chlamydiota bacterium]|nr:phosphoribosylglycinamide formyltransferase [Chlamydiota bacterium]